MARHKLTSVIRQDVTTWGRPETVSTARLVNLLIEDEELDYISVIDEVIIVKDSNGKVRFIIEDP